MFYYLYKNIIMSKKNNLIKKETLVELKKKYQVTSSGTNRELAER